MPKDFDAELSKNNILILSASVEEKVDHDSDNECLEAMTRFVQIEADKALAMSLQIESSSSCDDSAGDHGIKSDSSSVICLSASKPSSELPASCNVESCAELSVQEQKGVTQAQYNFAAEVKEAQNHDENQAADFNHLPAQEDYENMLAAASEAHENGDKPYCVTISGTPHSFNAYTFVDSKTSGIGSVDSDSNRKSSYICSCISCNDNMLLYGYLIKHMEVKGRHPKTKSKRVFVSRTYLKHLEKPTIESKFFLLDIVMTLCTVIKSSDILSPSLVHDTKTYIIYVLCQSARHHYFVLNLATQTIDFWNWPTMRNYFCDFSRNVRPTDLKKYLQTRFVGYTNFHIIFDPAKINTTGVYARLAVLGHSSSK